MTYKFISKDGISLAISLKGKTAFFRGGVYETDNNQEASQLRSMPSFGTRFTEVTEKPKKPNKADDQ